MIRPAGHIKGSMGVVVWENDLPSGYEAICPICEARNFAPYDPDGSVTGSRGALISYPNAEHGSWCPHALGGYAGARVTDVQFLFR